jgi:hypothetical protein
MADREEPLRPRRRPGTIAAVRCRAGLASFGAGLRGGTRSSRRRGGRARRFGEALLRRNARGAMLLGTS